MNIHEEQIKFTQLIMVSVMNVSCRYYSSISSCTQYLCRVFRMSTSCSNTRSKAVV